MKRMMIGVVLAAMVLSLGATLPAKSPTTRPFPEDKAKAFAAAQEAEARLHRLCDSWAAQSASGKSADKLRSEILAADVVYYDAATRAGLPMWAARCEPEILLRAGKYPFDTGKSASYMIGFSEGRDVDVWLWSRGTWEEATGVRAGFGGMLRLSESEHAGKFSVGKPQEVGKDILRLPYTLGSQSGTIDFHLNNFTVHPDRGVMDHGGSWKPFATTQPAKER